MAKIAKIAVVGPGAMGCLFAVMLQEAGNHVVLIDRDARRAREINRDGVKLVEGGKTRAVKVDVVVKASLVGTVDIVMICVKAFDTRAAAKHAAACVGAGTAVVSLQNGYGNAGAISSALPRACVICGTTGFGATLAGAGVSRWAGRGETLLAPLTGPGQASARRVRAVLAGAGFQTTVSGDPESVVWSKLVINAAINPLTSILEVQNGALLEIPEAKEAMLKAAAEAAAVARASGVHLAYVDEGREVVKVCGATQSNISSMLQDIRRGNRTEVDFINGVVVSRGAELGVPTPVNARLLQKIRDLESRISGNNRDGEASRRQS